eukprot:TRINITY_DN7703_c0_g1_i1.p1 TRINITY_DN7703_c0_g1~~TRINITY_DN7703_c0_g1_i1.p1  ORF type:complete len:205 (+),score=34.54 TRINITY_DN7703_c0_g1_i1:24-638(+)
MAFEFAPEDAELEIHNNGEIPNGKVGATSALPFKVVYAGKGTPARISPADLVPKVTDPSGNEVASKITGAASTFKVEWKPSVKGQYKVDLELRSKFQQSWYFTVFGAVSLKSYFQGEKHASVGAYPISLVTADEDGNRLPGGGDTKFEFQISAPENSFSDFKIRDKKDGTFNLEVKLLLPNTEYQLIACYQGHNISNSPFIVHT